MVVLLDTNIILTYLTNREDKYRAECIEIMRLCAAREVKGYMAFHSLSIIWYLLRKQCPAAERRRLLKNVCGVLTVASASQSQIIAAIEKDTFTDFEDCLQDMCAVNAYVDYIITENIKDFESSITKALLPDMFLKKWGKRSE